jgi:serine/threonine protein kinase
MSDSRPDTDPDALAPGTRLGEFEIERVLGIGGFGIVYLAFDHALERHVALKEYMPASLASRRGGTQIAVRSQAHEKTFGIGLRSFVNEARLLARFDHPALVKVYRFWEENGTAYMVMPYYEGQTLSAARAAMASPPNEDALLALADAMLGALEALHREQVYHRDVAPDNILLQTDGTPVLLDFGAARLVISDRTQSLTAILKPNFAPIEQYGDSGPQRQGPWSDVYSLGAVLHFCVIGRPPIPAALRMLHDELPLLLTLRHELVADDGSHYTEAFLGAIDSALAVRPEARPQHAAAFLAALHGVPPPPGPMLALPPAAPAGVPRVAARESFAPTEVRARRVQASPAVTTAWSTIGVHDDAAMASVLRASRRTQGKAGRPVAAGAAWLARLSSTSAPRLALLGLLPLMLASLIGYASMRPDALPSEDRQPTRVEAPPPARTPGGVAATPLTTAATATAPTESASAVEAPTAAVARENAPAPTPAVSPAPLAAQRKASTAAAAPAEPAPREARESPVDTGIAAAAAEPQARSQTVRRVRPAAVAPQTARQSCGDRNFFSMQFCLQRQCGQPEFEQDAECIDLRARQAGLSRQSF